MENTPRKTGRPWYRKAKDCWYVWHLGRQHPLAKGRRSKAEAYARFAELLAAEPFPATSPLTVAKLVGEFETAAANRVKRSTLVSYRCVLKPLVAEFGTVQAADLDSATVTAFVGSRRWSASTRRYALVVLSGVYTWGVVTKRLPANPIHGIRKPPAKSRGAEVLITAALHERILSVSSVEFRRFLTAMRETGARPGEVARVEAKDVSWEASCWVLTEHKTDSTGRLRTIYLSEAVLAICRELAAMHPTGPLFRTTRGDAWRRTAWKQAMKRAKRKLGLPRIPLVSGYRHTFATDALEAGVPETHVAELLGHSSTAMIFKHYGHLTARGQSLRKSLNRIRPSGE